VSQAENTTTKHVDEITLLMYVERQLDRERAQEVSLHTQTCTRCMTLLRALDRESRLLTRAMLEQDEPLPARLSEFHERVKRSMQWIWGAVFGLAVLGVYALYTGYIEPWEQQLEQAGFGGTNLLNLLIFQGAFWKGWQSMFSLFEVFALMGIAGFGIFAFRKYLRRGSALAVMFATMSLLMVAAVPASAAECRKGDTVEVKKDETIKSDLFITGKHMKVEGTVDGDVYAFGQQLDVPGRVTGDVICFAQSARISGQVDGNIRSFANNITITGTVDRSVTAFNEILTLDPNGKIGHSLTVFSSSLSLDGKVGRDVLTFFNDATVAGTIGGSLKAKGNSLTISSGAQIDGKSSFEGEKPATISTDAKLASPLEFKLREHKHDTNRGSSYYVWQTIWAAAFILFGMVLFGILPLFSREAITNAENLGASFGLGVLVGFAVPIAAIIACVTVIGLFVGLSAFFLWYAALYFAQVIVGTLVGQWIFGKTRETWPLIGRMVFGLVILRGCMTIPYLGVWLKIAIIIWGIGAISLAIYRRLQPVVAPNIPSMPLGPIGTPLPPQTTVGGI
jgi:cytoskeletal protein CcmA (bactofilin family)